MKKIIHIVGERVFYRVALLSAGARTNLSSCTVSFRGKLNDKTNYLRHLSLSDNTTVTFSPNDLLDELVDRKLVGRFYFSFPNGSVRASKEILIVVKK